MREEGPILLFDGVCNVCNASVRFVIERDPAAAFRFASLQSPFGQALLERFGLDTEDHDTMVLVEGDRFWLRTDALMRVFAGLRAPWPLLALARVLPRGLRDAGYAVFARNRYRWFGKREACLLPSPELQARFLG